MIRKKKSNYAMSSRSRAAIIGACVLAAVVLILLDHGAIRPGWVQQVKSGAGSDARDFTRYHGGVFNVVKIVDGDTIDIDARDGRHGHTRIRLWGIDTPETKSDRYGVMYFGPEAAEFTKELAFGKPVTIYLDEENRTRGRYGRLLAYVQLPDKRFLNELLVSEGYAYADTRFRHSLYHKYQQLEAAARGARKGLWQGITRDQLPQWLQRHKPKLLVDK